MSIPKGMNDTTFGGINLRESDPAGNESLFELIPAGLIVVRASRAVAEEVSNTVLCDIPDK